MTRLSIEWLNGTTLLLLFPTHSSALTGHTLVSKAGFDPSEGDDPLSELLPISVAFSLLPMAKTEPEPVDSLAGSELIPNEAIKRKGRGNFVGHLST